jgi:hypothetical protein
MALNMKKLTTLILLLLSPLVVAQEKEIWACQETDTNGLFWEDGRWERRGVTSTQYLFTLDGSNSTIKAPEDLNAVGLNCLYEAVDEYWFCSGHFLAKSFILDQATGAAGFSTLLGAIHSAARRDSLKVSALQCTKF